MKRPSWFTAEDAAADRAARYGTDATPSTGRPAGARMKRSGNCPRCDEPIIAEQHAVLRKGSWIHTGCAPGADDE